MGKEKISGKLMDRDDGACADKINAHSVMQTIAFLRDRKSYTEVNIDITRVHRHMAHAIAKGQLLTSFSQQLLKYRLPTLAASPKLKQLSTSVSADPKLGIKVDVQEGEFWCVGKPLNKGAK